jgi:hypothetical protein
MSTITTRVTTATGATLKNAPLTNAEIDANFINLNNDKLELADAVTTNTPDSVVKRDGSGNFAANVINVAGVVTGTTTYPTTNATQAMMESGLDTGTKFMSPANVKQAIDVLAMQTVGETTKDMTGFERIGGSTISFVDATRTFTIAPSGTTPTSKTYVVTAAGMQFYLDGVQSPAIELIEGGTYTFDQSDPSNAGHPLRFSTTSNGTHGGGTEYTTGVTVTGTPGTAGAKTVIVVAAGAPNLFYYCTNHSGMGDAADTIQAYFVWYRGKRYTVKTSLSIVVTATAGNHWIYIDPTTLTLQQTTSNTNIFTDYIVVAAVYLDTATTKGIIVADQRHSSARDTTSHDLLHNAIGAIWKSGGDMTYTLNDPANVTVSFTSPIYLQDEDLVHTISHSGSPSGYFQQVLTGTASLPTLYMNGATYTEVAASTVPWVAGTATARINPISSSSGSLADAGEGRYLNYWIVLTNDIVRPIKAIMGRISYASLSGAYAEVFTPYDLPFLDMAPMYQVTLYTSGTYANKVKLMNVRKIYDRQSAAVKSFADTAHSSLPGLDADDHTQYLHLSTARTVTANHTFNGNNTFGGTNGFQRITMTDINSNVIPTTNNAFDLGSSTNAWRNVYTNDLHLSNVGKPEGNDIDGTTGDWTIQEGQTDLYIINNKTGKRFKFTLQDVE